MDKAMLGIFIGMVFGITWGTYAGTNDYSMKTFCVGTIIISIVAGTLAYCL